MLGKLSPKLFGIGGALNRELDSDGTILDVGCGRNSPLQYVDKGNYKIGIDYYPDYIKTSKSKHIHDKYLCEDITKHSYDTKYDYVTCTEVIEHLDKQAGIELLNKLSNCYTKKLIISTPNGFLDIPASELDNPAEKHISGWTVKELKDLGFKVYGVSGLKILWNRKNNRVRSPYLLFSVLRVLSEPIAYLFPSYAYQLVGVK